MQDSEANLHHSLHEMIQKQKRVGTKKEVKNPARKPTAHLLTYATNHYTRFLRESWTSSSPSNLGVEPVRGPFVSYSKYDNYQLFIEPQLTDLDTIPTSGVRLDDNTLAKVLAVKKAKFLTHAWPADIDQLGMVRATRVPLGIAAKVFVEAGQKDITGLQVNVGEEGWYYLWWRGLHLLCGKEGLDAGIYRIRPSHEAFIADGLIWLKHFKAVLQTDPMTEID